MKEDGGKAIKTLRHDNVSWSTTVLAHDAQKGKVLHSIAQCRSQDLRAPLQPINAGPYHPLTLMQSWGLLPNLLEYFLPLTLGGLTAP